MFRIKICGITDFMDALLAADAGADAIGLNFFRKSRRYVPVDVAKQIVGDIDGLVTCWGVFVNAPSSEVLAGYVGAGLDGVQLHGDETPQQIAEIGTELRRFDNQPSIIRVRRWNADGFESVRADLDACCRCGALPKALLLDASRVGEYGGTGQTLPWDELADHRITLGDVPLILAGGLHPDNVAEAIRIVRPQAVDVASGVESSPGKKDAAKVRDFVAAAQAAFAAL